MVFQNKTKIMQRRIFLRTVPLGVVATAWLPSFYDYTRLSLDLSTWVKQNDVRVQHYLDTLEQRPEHPYFGGLPNDDGLYMPMSTATMLSFFAAAFISPSSSFYQRSDLAQAMQNAANCLRQMQHDDGTIDLLSTNFHSTPDTGFVVEPLCLAYGLLQQQPSLAVLPLLRAFLLRAGEALSIGGIHTPNHRWVVCMALARLHSLFPNSNYLKRIEQWLYERIDIDPDGQYTERSTNIYTPLTNRCLITMARLLGRPELYEPVRKNLMMMLYYVHPNGELVTEASGRQDRNTIGQFSIYYYAYRYMGLLDNDAVFAGAVQYIEANTKPESLSSYLPYFLEDITLKRDLSYSTALPTHYFKYFPYSNIVRIRKGNYDATVLADSATLFTFTKGKAVLQAVRWASAFFGKGQMIAPAMQVIDDKIRMEQELSAPYLQPYPITKLPNDGDWQKMPRENRAQSEVQFLRSVLWVKELESGGFSLTIKVDGTDHVPLAIELAFRKGGQFSGVEALPNLPNAWILPSGYGTYTFDSDQISFGEGSKAHQWTQLRGALPKLDADSVYITGFTPFEMKLDIV